MTDMKSDQTSDIDGLSQTYSDEHIRKLAEASDFVIRAYSASIGESPRKPWARTTEDRRQRLCAAVRNILEGRVGSARAQHERWLADHAGWSWGEEVDEAAGRHPALMPYDELPLAQRLKGDLCRAVVFAVHKALTA